MSEAVVSTQSTGVATPVTKEVWEAHGIEALHIPTPDFCPPSLSDLREGVEFMERIVNSGKIVYVHCKAGRGRSVVVTICYLAHKKGFSVDQACELLRSRRPQVNMGQAQIQACRDYVETYLSSSGSSPEKETKCSKLAFSTSNSSKKKSSLDFNSEGGGVMEEEEEE
eukprot:TRINITY_DN2474_c0_g1_i8.p1 TRINITY_DN2474_c0_g1~~TRINITY_DN2474_c0_g1_i8.p1  ORF type:complete len:193 (+),score=44.30 TRINITY_DN2474_c0_g1_i8:78-581(+)